MSRERHDFDDAELRRALRAAAPEPPLDEVDWDRLHGRILADARGILARATSRRSWWEVAAVWARRGVPLTATAAAAAAIALLLAGPPMGGTPVELEAYASTVTLEDVLAAEAGPLFTAESAEEALARAILYGDGAILNGNMEEW